MVRVDSLKDRVCVVTGATGVLCSVMVEALCEQGAKVAMISRTQAKLDALEAKLKEKGHQVMSAAADVTDMAQMTAARDKIGAAWGEASLLVNGAGGNSPKATTKVETMTPADLEDLASTFFGIDLAGFDHVFNLNLKGTLAPTLLFAEAMAKAKAGNVINISSMSALLPLTKIPAYSAAKAAVDSFTKWLATHLAPMNIRVNAISPGFFATDQNRFLLFEEDGTTLTARGKKIHDGTPMGRFGAPEDLTGALLFLASEMSTFVTGTVLPVDGGFSAYPGV